MVVKRVQRESLPLRLTHSAKGSWLDCNRLYYYKYDQMLEPKTHSTALVIGTMVHEFLARLMKHEDINSVMKDLDKAVNEARKLNFDDPEDFEANATTLESMMRGWDKNRGQLSEFQPYIHEGEPWIENKFKVKLPTGDTIEGMIDGLVVIDDELWLVEHKTTSQLGPQYISRLIVDAQVTMYIWAVWKMLGVIPRGTIYNVIRKPSIRQKKGESLIEYQNRIAADYITRKDFYFYQTQLYRDQQQLQDFENSLMDVIDDIKRSRARDRWVQNTNHCTRFGTCPFMHLCANGMKKELMILYTRRDVLFPELAT